MSTLEKAISMAALAHEGQKDKAGKTYILHLLRIVQSVPDGNEKIVAVLHDILEDTSITVEILKAEGFSQEVIAAVEAITRKDGEAYDAYIDRCSRSRLAAVVKIADLRDNMDLSRLAYPGEGDRKRTQRYQRAIEQLEKAVKKSTEPQKDKSIISKNPALLFMTGTFDPFHNGHKEMLDIASHYFKDAPVKIIISSMSKKKQPAPVHIRIARMKEMLADRPQYEIISERELNKVHEYGLVAWINGLINANPDKKIVHILGGDAFNRALQKGYTPWDFNLPYSLAVIPRQGYETEICTRAEVTALPASKICISSTEIRKKDPEWFKKYMN